MMILLLLFLQKQSLEKTVWRPSSLLSPARSHAPIPRLFPWNRFTNMPATDFSLPCAPVKAHSLFPRDLESSLLQNILPDACDSRLVLPRSSCFPSISSRSDGVCLGGRCRDGGGTQHWSLISSPLPGTNGPLWLDTGYLSEVSSFEKISVTPSCPAAHHCIYKIIDTRQTCEQTCWQTKHAKILHRSVNSTASCSWNGDVWRILTGNSLKSQQMLCT